MHKEGQFQTYLDWGEYRDAGMGDAYADIPKEGGDFARAVAVCINSEQCQQAGRGVMCPSFRVTGNPNHSPGGRVRLLKRALNGQPDALTRDPELSESMALCVACKGCKRECENSVDMAQIKSEYLAQQHARNTPPLRTRLFAYLPRLLSSRWIRGAIKVRNRLPLLQRLGKPLLGLSARALPEPAARAFTQTETRAEGERNVVLFVDTFTRYFEPDNADAAIAILEAAGYTVHLVRAADGEGDRPLCCGRTHIAHGLVEQAAEEARRVVRALAPFAEKGYPILGLEPSCLLALRDDYRALPLGPEAEAVSAQALLFEEFLAREWGRGAFELKLKSPDNAAPILVHGHCHQKAVGAMKAMRKVLKRLPGAQFQFIEASCCGMAGSFGYEAEHESLSRQMAESSLVPAIKAAPEATLVANGFSCRNQIDDTAGRKARHLVQLLRERIELPR